MAQPAKPAKPAVAKKDAAADAAPPKNKKKLILIVAALVLALGGVAGWVVWKDKHSDGAEEVEAVKVEVAKEPLFIPLDTFTVNLQKEESDQYLQIGITFKLFEPELAEKIKSVMPEIKSKLNLLLSSKKPSELSTVAGKKKLAAEIAVEANAVLGIRAEPVVSVAAVPVSAPVVASEVTPAPAGEPAKTAEGEATAEAASAPAEAAPAPVVKAPPKKMGVVDVLFTSFIIQ